MFLATEEIGEVDHIAIIKGKEIICSKCKTCNIYRPPRSFHCSDCQACIEVHDHHCPWVGTCVAKRNHRFFLCFGFFTLTHALFTFGIDITYFIKFTNFQSATTDPFKVACIVLTIFSSIIICCLGGLTCYHTRLACIGATTNEEIRGKYGPEGNLYDDGVSRNCRSFCYGGTSRVF